MGFICLKTYILAFRLTVKFWADLFSELNGSDQHTIFYMSIDCVSLYFKLPMPLP
jgi:hypothetical protein